MVKMIVVLMSVAMLAVAVPAGAQSSFLHVGEAKLLGGKVAKQLAHKVHAGAVKRTGCKRTDSRRVQCSYDLLVAGSPAEVCHVKVAVAKTAVRTVARSFDFYCEAAG